MKNLLYLFSLILLPGILFSQSSFDLEKSKIKWTGKKITTESHWGSLYFSEASLFFDGSDLMPGAVGAGSFWTGMVDYTNGKPAQEVADAIQASWDAIK